MLSNLRIYLYTYIYIYKKQVEYLAHHTIRWLYTYRNCLFIQSYFYCCLYRNYITVQIQALCLCIYFWFFYLSYGGATNLTLVLFVYLLVFKFWPKKLASMYKVDESILFFFIRVYYIIMRNFKLTYTYLYIFLNNIMQNERNVFLYIIFIYNKSSFYFCTFQFKFLNYDVNDSFQNTIF